MVAVQHQRARLSLIGSGHASVLRFGRDLAVVLQGRYDIIGFVRAALVLLG